jgi:hypothetical protein
MKKHVKFLVVALASMVALLGCTTPITPAAPAEPTPLQGPDTSTIRVKATLDGRLWMGKLTYDVIGTKDFSGSSVIKDFSNLPVGTYRVFYRHGGPFGAKLETITLESTQTTVASQTTTFTFGFFMPNRFCPERVPSTIGQAR